MKRYLMMLLLGWFLASGAGRAEGLVSLRGAELDVRSVLATIGLIGGVNMVLDDTVSGKLSLNLQDVPFEVALETVTKAKGLSCQRVGDVIVVGSSERIARSFSEVWTFRLSHAKATEVVKLLQVVGGETKPAAQEKGALKSGEAVKEAAVDGQNRKGRLQVDEYGNLIVFYGSAQEAAQIKAILEQVDRTYCQVELEAEIVALNRQAGKALGIDWHWSQSTNYPEYRAPRYKDGILTEPGQYLRGKDEMSGTIRYGRSPAGIPYEFYYNSTIKALLSSGDAKLLAKPKIMTLSGQKATINIGDRVPVPTTTTSNNITTTSLEYQDCGIILQYLPRVNADGQILALVHTEVSSPLFVPDLKAYKFTKRSADTEVRIKDGETLIIGGLIGKEEMKSLKRIPFLSDLPVLGGLFKNREDSGNESELVIFLTARIVK